MIIKGITPLAKDNNTLQSQPNIQRQAVIRPGDIIEGKIDHIISNEKAVVIVGNEKFLAETNAKVVEGETVLFQTVKNGSSIILKILETNYAPHLEQLSDVTRLMKSFTDLPELLTNDELNQILSNLYDKPYSNINMNEPMIEYNIIEQFQSLMKKYLKDQGSLITVLFDKIAILSRNGMLHLDEIDEKLKKFLSYLMTTKIYNELSSKSGQPIYTWYFPFYMGEDRSDIFVNFFGKRNNNHNSKRESLNIVVHCRLSDRRDISFSVYLRGKKISYHVYSKDLIFLNFLKENEHKLTERINALGCYIERSSFNLLREENNFFNENIIQRMDNKKLHEVV